jgi:hypothetical protein
MWGARRAARPRDVRLARTFIAALADGDGMESPPLAPVYLDNQPVSLMGDPRPRVAKVVAASGRPAGSYDVVLLEDEADRSGVLVGLEDVLDRTQEPTRPIYLTCVERDADLDLDVAEEATEPTAARVIPGASGPPDRGGEEEEEWIGSLGSPYARTGTDTAEPGMARQDAEQAGFGSGAGEGTSHGSRESGKATAARSRMAAGLEDPFGREGLHGKAPHPEETPEPSGLGAIRPVRAIGRSGTVSEAGADVERAARRKAAAD